VRYVLVRAFRAGSETASGGAESDELGFFHVAPLPPGTYLLEASRLGFETQTREVGLPPGRRMEEDFVMVAVPLELEGISVEAE